MMKENRLDAEQKKLFGDILVKATDHLFDPPMEPSMEPSMEESEQARPQES